MFSIDLCTICFVYYSFVYYLFFCLFYIKFYKVNYVLCINAPIILLWNNILNSDEHN